jgi:hypothetical protein
MEMVAKKVEMEKAGKIHGDSIVMMMQVR